MKIQLLNGKLRFDNGTQGQPTENDWWQYCKFLGKAGNTPFDISDRAHITSTGNISEDPVIKKFNDVSLQSNNGWISISDNKEDFSYDEDMTFDMWVYIDPTNTSVRGFINHQAFDHYVEFILQYTDSFYLWLIIGERVQIGPDTYTFLATPYFSNVACSIPEPGWHLVGFSYNASTQNLLFFFDGQKQLNATPNPPQDKMQNFSSIYIGRNYDANSTTYNFDEPRLLKGYAQNTNYNIPAAAWEKYNSVLTPVTTPAISSPWTVTPDPIWFTNSPSYDYLINDNLVGGWHFEENTGTTRYDYVNGAEAEDVTTSVAKGDGIYKSGCYFDGTTNQRIRISKSQLDLTALYNSGAFSIVLWFKHNNGLVTNPLISAIQDDNIGVFPNPPLYVWNGFRISCSDTLHLTFANNAESMLEFKTEGPPFYDDNLWHCLIMTLNVTTAEVYVDNTYVAGSGKGGMGECGDDGISIGGTGSTSLTGYEDELMIFNKVLNESERTFIYNDGIGKFAWNE